MNTTLKTITPEWAENILKNHNPKNRIVNDAFVARLARDIKAGAFVTTHQGIAFDTDGNLLDGQHRLAAIVFAKKSVDMLVTTGIDPSHKFNGTSINTFEVIDSGNKRGTGSMLQMAGFINANRLAACVRVMLLACADVKKWSQGVSTAQIHNALAIIGASAERCVNLSASARMFNAPSYIVAAVMFYHTVEPEKAEKFLLETCNISGDMRSPSRALITWARRHPATGGASVGIGIKTAASAMQSFDEGEELQKIYASDSAFRWLLSLNKPMVAKLGAILK
jgi:hypothetical protein